MRDAAALISQCLQMLEIRQPQSLLRLRCMLGAEARATVQLFKYLKSFWLRRWTQFSWEPSTRTLRASGGLTNETHADARGC